MTLMSLVVSALEQCKRAQRGHSTVWRPVNNPISRRTDETKSVSELFTQRQCSSPESALSMQHWWKQRCFSSHRTSPCWPYADTVASASWHLLVTDSLSDLSYQILLTSLLDFRKRIRLRAEIHWTLIHLSLLSLTRLALHFDRGELGLHLQGK